MKYLIIMPDYTGSGIRDEFEGEISLNDLDLPIDFINEFTSWHNEYREIIPLDNEERKKKMCSNWKIRHTRYRNHKKTYKVNTERSQNKIF